VILGQREEPAGTLDQYLGSIAGRMRAAALSRGLGALAATALVVTAACVYLANRAAFSPFSVLGSRAFILSALVTVGVYLLAKPLLRLARGRAARLAADEAERRAPEFSGRLRTWADERDRAASRGRAPTPLLSLLARETEQAALTAPPGMIVSRPATLAVATVACGLAVALVWLGTAGPGYWQYGTARLWAGWFLDQGEPLYELQVEPGDTTIRRGGRLDVTATPVGFDPGGVTVHAKFESSVDWERAPMGPQLEGPGYRFSFSMVREPLRYYVEAGRMRSREFNVGVVALPEVEAIRVTYTYPAWSGLEPRVEDPGGDVLAVPGTRVEITLTTDKPIEDGLLVLGNREIALRDERAEFEVTEDTTYHVAAMYRGERVRLTEDYFVTAVPDKKPEVKILKPGRDWKATSIEEVRVRVEASDDFGLRGVKLFYAVNGADRGSIDLAKADERKSATAAHMFYLEDLGAPGAATLLVTRDAESLPPPAPEAGLLPGDLISYYVTARDAKREVRSDMYFISVQPFERRFSQSQQAGGQQGQGQQQDEISRRQREIVIATWNLIKEREAEDGRDVDKLRESAEMLSQLQGTLMQQAQTLVQRTRARQLTGTDPKFAQFAEYMEQAAEFMAPAATALQEFRLDDAVGPEQQALQFLLRAENLFTDIQVSMGQGGAGGGASRDLAEMFELEMDLEKNQYETGAGASGRQIEQEIDEAMRKLEELARRQEQLAERTRDRSRASFEQRWRQEMLRREAEDLKRELEQLQRRQQGQQGQQQQASRQGGQSSSSEGGQSGQSNSSQQLQQAIRQLDRAANSMRQGGQGGDPRSAAATAQRELERAVEALQQQRQQRSQAALDQMADQAADLAEEQESTAAEIQASLRVALEALKAQGGRQTGQLPTGMTREEEIELSDRKRAMGEQLAEIERGMQEQVRQLRERNPAASEALLNALVEMQQSEVAGTLQYAAELVRRGMAPYVASNEESASRALRRLRDNLRAAGGLAQEEVDRQGRSMAGVLTDLERLRRDLEEAARGAGGTESPERNSDSASGSQEPGQSPGGQSEQPGQSGQRGSTVGQRRGARGGWGGPNGDRWRTPLGPVPSDPETLRRMESALDEGAAQVPRLTQRLRSDEGFDPRDVAELRRFAQELGDGRFRGNPELLAQEYRKLLALLEQLEVTLRRQVELDDKEEVRAIVSEPVPEHYRDAVAEYYRRLGAAQ